VHLISPEGVEGWPEAAKEEIARKLIERVGETLG
jgi:hypothetical protein